MRHGARDFPYINIPTAHSDVSKWVACALCTDKGTEAQQAHRERGQPCLPEACSGPLFSAGAQPRGHLCSHGGLLWYKTFQQAWPEDRTQRVAHCAHRSGVSIPLFRGEGPSGPTSSPAGPGRLEIARARLLLNLCSYRTLEKRHGPQRQAVQTPSRKGLFRMSRGSVV